MRIPALALAALVSVGGCDGAATALPDEPAPSPPSRGSLILSNVTSGGAFDMDGYLLAVDGGPQIEMDANQDTTLFDVASGTHTVELRGLASNCDASSGLIKTVNVRPGIAATAAFQIACEAPPELSRVRLLVSTGRALTLMNADGTARVTVLEGSAADWAPAPSPDGTKIAFTRANRGSTDLMVTNSDGTGTRFLAADVSSPDWSPDGRRIAVGGSSIRAIAMDSGDSRSLTVPTSRGYDSPRWSPDGQRIAYTRFFGDSDDVWVMNADGSAGIEFETGSPPVWSPDGEWIAYRPATGSFGTTILARHSDGSATRSLFESPTVAFFPTDWSRDGSMLLMIGVRGPLSRRTPDLYLVRLSDGGLWRLTALGGPVIGRFWEPIVAR